MHVFVQIALGTAILLLCTVLHVSILLRFLRSFRKQRRHRPAESFHVELAGVILPVLVIAVSHTIQVYLWAATLYLVGALRGHEEPIYFALVSYTSLGYGDVTLSEDFRIFGAMAAITGILTFGTSTAFLVGFFSRIIGESGKT